MKMIATLGEPPRQWLRLSDRRGDGARLFGRRLLGFVGAAATPKTVIAKIQSDTAKVLAVPETRKRIEELGMEVVTTRPEQFEAMIQSEMKRWSRVISEAKIEVE
jgi:tripartite-type tricarboxylate transporter receptor subunit TctC